MPARTLKPKAGASEAAAKPFRPPARPPGMSTQVPFRPPRELELTAINGRCGGAKSARILHAIIRLLAALGRRRTGSVRSIHIHMRRHTYTHRVYTCMNTYVYPYLHTFIGTYVHICRRRLKPAAPTALAHVSTHIYVAVNVNSCSPCASRAPRRRSSRRTRPSTRRTR
jgi:hypothetical protein